MSDVGILKSLKGLKSSREAFGSLRRALLEQPRSSRGSFERTPSVLMPHGRVHVGVLLMNAQPKLTNWFRKGSALPQSQQ